MLLLNRDFFIESLIITRSSLLTAYKHWCTRDQGSRDDISMAYASLLASPSKHPYMLAWERDLDFELDPEYWYSVLRVSFIGYTEHLFDRGKY